MTDLTNEMSHPWDKCEHGSFQHVDGIAPCYKCHPELKPSDPAAKAREIEQILIDCKDGQLERTVGLIMSILEAERKAVYEEIATKQALIRGESIMLNGKVMTNEELYKQPTDYIKEANAEGYRRGKADQWDKMKKFFDGTERKAYLAGLEEAVCLIEEADKQGLVIEEMVDHLRAKAKELK